MKTKDLLALEVSASSSHLFSKYQNNAFFMNKILFFGGLSTQNLLFWIIWASFDVHISFGKKLRMKKQYFEGFSFFPSK